MRELKAELRMRIELKMKNCCTANIYNHITSLLLLKRCSITANGRVLILAVLQYSYSASTLLLIVVIMTTIHMNS